LARSGVSGEIVIGDNGSNDGSQDMPRCGARVVDIPTRAWRGIVGRHASARANNHHGRLRLQL